MKQNSNAEQKHQKYQNKNLLLNIKSDILNRILMHMAVIV